MAARSLILTRPVWELSQREGKKDSQHRPGFVKQIYQNCEDLDDSDACELPRLLITNLDNDNANEYLFNQEAFVGALGQTSLPGSNPSE